MKPNYCKNEKARNCTTCAFSKYSRDCENMLIGQFMIGDLAEMMLIPERSLRKMFKESGAKQVDAQKENPAELVPRVCVMELVARRDDRVGRMLSNLL